MADLGACGGRGGQRTLAARAFGNGMVTAPATTPARRAPGAAGRRPPRHAATPRDAFEHRDERREGAVGGVFAAAQQFGKFGVLAEDGVGQAHQTAVP